MSSKIWVSWFSESEIRSLIYNETKIAGRLYTLKELFSIHRADYCKYLWQFYKLVNAYLKTVSSHGVPPGFRFVILLHQLPGLQYYAWIVHFNVAFSFRYSEKLFQRKFHVFFSSFFLFVPFCLIALRKVLILQPKLSHSSLYNPGWLQSHFILP